MCAEHDEELSFRLAFLQANVSLTLYCYRRFVHVQFCISVLRKLQSCKGGKGTVTANGDVRREAELSLRGHINGKLRVSPSRNPANSCSLLKAIFVKCPKTCSCKFCSDLYRHVMYAFIPVYTFLAKTEYYPIGSWAPLFFDPPHYFFDPPPFF